MKLPLPTYRQPASAGQLIEVISVFVTKIDDAIKTLMDTPNMQFHGKNHLIQLVMFHSGLFMSEESFRDVEAYIGEGIDAILRDFGGRP